MGANGGPAQRISFGEGAYSTPVWSPRGDYIAFTKQAQGRFAIGIMRPDGSGERILTDGYHNEGPTWSPNGRVVMFFRDPGGSAGPSLFTVDVTGRNEQSSSIAELCVRSGLVTAAAMTVLGTMRSRTDVRTSAPFPKFVIRLSILLHELRKQRGTSKSMILVPLFDLKFLTEFAAGDVGTSNRRH